MALLNLCLMCMYSKDRTSKKKKERTHVLWQILEQVEATLLPLDEMKNIHTDTTFKK